MHSFREPLWQDGHYVLWNWLELAGIDTNKYKGHSTRGASASTAKVLEANINAIMRNASWRNSKSLAKYYHKSVEDPGEIQRTILRTVRK